MKNLLLLALSFLTTLAVAQPPRDPHLMRIPPKPENIVYQFRDTARNEMKRGQNGPQFMIYPNGALSEAEAEALVEELGLKELVLKTSGSVGVFKPMGKTYDNAADLEAYKKFIDMSRIIGNLKILGFGNGATFVNNVIAPVANEVAGIFTYGGKLNVKPADIPVPAYIALGNSALAKFYAKANDAVEVSRDKQHIVYENADEPLQRVVLSLNKKATRAEAVADAWETLLSKNYRYSNFKHTHYMGAKFGQYGAYELEPLTDFETLGVKRIAKREQLAGPDFPANKTSFWYEYIPAQCENAAPKSVPLVVLLHGNNNDNRTQSETSGFVEVAAKEGLMLAEIDWQGNGGMNGSEQYIGMSGIEQIVLQMCQRYPQIDPSRIYCQGLSAGSMHSCAIGIEKSYLFAAVAGHSGGIFDGPVYGFSPEGLFRNARQKSGKAEVALFLCVGTDDDTIGFPNKEHGANSPYYNALNLYAALNDMPKVVVDFDAEPVLGIKMENRETIETNKHITLETGSLCKERTLSNGETRRVPMMQFTAIMHYGHWNFRPIAQRMWDFFSHYRRDVDTGALIYQD